MKTADAPHTTLPYGAMTFIAKETRRSIGHVSRVYHGERRDPVVEAAIARRLGRPFPAPEMSQ
jgi:hypothetical protein